MTKWICDFCVNDLYLRSWVGRHASASQGCSYCHRKSPTIEVHLLAEKCGWVIEEYFDIRFAGEINDGGGEGSCVGDLLAVLENILHARKEVKNDIAVWLYGVWLAAEGGDGKNSDALYFYEKYSLHDELSQLWGQMEHSLKYVSRLINPRAIEILEMVFGPVSADRLTDGGGVIVEIGPGREIDKLFRARVFQDEESLQEAFKHPEINFGPPPAGICPAGRMNSKGVSVFYGSTDSTTALNEVRPPVGSYVVMAEFKIVRALRVLDLSRLSKIRIHGSIFDPETLKGVQRSDFLRSLAKRITMPVTPNSEDTDYLVTQLIADYLATNDSLNLDGIAFSSAQNVHHDNLQGDINLILFKKASAVRFCDLSYSTRAEINLWDFDQEKYLFAPEIRTLKMDALQVGDPFGQDYEQLYVDSGRVVTLELNRDFLRVSKIEGVKYIRQDFQVRNIKSG